MSTPPQPLSIVHVMAPAPFGGLETVTEALVDGLRAAGERVCVAPVLTPPEADGHPFVQRLSDLDIDVNPIVVGGRAYAEERRLVGEVLRSRRANVLHTHGYRSDVMDSGVGRKLGVPTVTTVHGFTGTGGVRGRLYEWLQLRAFRRFDVVVSVSDALATTLRARGVSGDSLRVVRNALPAPAALHTREDARARLGIGPAERTVVWVGRLTEEKAPDIMIRAAARVAASDVTFSIVGDGPMRESCERLAADLGLADRVRFHGVVADAARYLPAFDALALTSWTEGTPMVLLEAMASSTPIVATAVGGVPHLLSSDDAWLCAPGDAAAIGAAIEELLADPGRREQRARAARHRFDDECSVDRWVEAYREIYHGLQRR